MDQPFNYEILCKGMVEVVWYNDFRVTKLYRSQIYKFGSNFTIFAEKFDTTVGLREAAEQAMHDVMKRRPIK